MPIKKILTAAVVTAGLIAGNMTALSTAASAGGYRHHGGGYSDHYDGPRYGYRSHRFHKDHGYRHHRRHRSNKGAAIALGVGAVLLGAIIASEANRNRHYNRYYD